MSVSTLHPKSTFRSLYILYVSITCRYWADPDSFKNVDLRIRKFLFLFACTNSCANPLIYGVFSARSGGAPGVFASRERDVTSDQARRGWVRVDDNSFSVSMTSSLLSGLDWQSQSATGWTSQVSVCHQRQSTTATAEKRGADRG